MKKLLFVTDFYCEVKGRNYYEEDLYLTSRLMEDYNLITAHPKQAIAFIEDVDFVVLRNTGPVKNYQESYDDFVKAVQEKNIKTFNSFDGKADMKGKDYMLQLMNQNYPIIPTIDHFSEIEKLGTPQKYLVKLKDGADSIGIEIMSKEEILQQEISDKLIQPFLDFEYEVSFYYINDEFQYALYAPDKNKRWALEVYHANNEDLVFAKSFIDWNNMTRGITRVDACRLKDGSLLLVELEDLNPYLSLDLLDEMMIEKFVKNLKIALKKI
ncbi:hypothetical protein D1632_02835 [Chryseobacterium nematophagum]|uniref:ATP-grasp domain-containing protein n=1 Tax=Chryseobacterium nematophagum TaxID=2305228 RepID=A0A3M7LH62_9FLAO|nr:hypothetical protein [Chryseobacterium nematophagum]RMZ60926.1 hypothetical protein D1632_02835 [Chryseobacterium nematophagum]